MSGYAGTLQDTSFPGLAPAFLTSSQEADYLQDVHTNGFQPAHRRLLEAIKGYIESTDAMKWLPLLAASEAFQIHRQYLEIAQHQGVDFSIVTSADSLFIALFGTIGLVILNIQRSNLSKTAN